MSNPTLRMIVRAIEDAEKQKFNVEAIVRLVLARRDPAARGQPLEDLYIDKLIELNMERFGTIEGAAPLGEAA